MDKNINYFQELVVQLGSVIAILLLQKGIEALG